MLGSDVTLNGYYCIPYVLYVDIKAPGIKITCSHPEYERGAGALRCEMSGANLQKYLMLLIFIKYRKTVIKEILKGVPLYPSQLGRT